MDGMPQLYARATLASHVVRGKRESSMPFVCQLTRRAAQLLLECTVKCSIIRAMSNETAASPSGTNAVEPLRARLSADLRTAMKARDKSTIDTLRCLLAVLDNAGAQDPAAYPSEVFGASSEVPRKSLTEEELQALLRAEVSSRNAAATQYERGGRRQDAARLRAELALIGRYVA